MNLALVIYLWASLSFGGFMFLMWDTEGRTQQIVGFFVGAILWPLCPLVWPVTYLHDRVWLPFRERRASSLPEGK